MRSKSLQTSTVATHVAERARPTARVRRARLRVLSGSEAGRTVDVGAEGVLIGSKPPADLVIRDPNVSRKHAEIRRGTNGFVLRDLGSTNGTFLGDVRIDSVYLGDGMVFTIGLDEIAFTSIEEGIVLPPEPPDAAVGFVARSAAMRELVAAIRRFAPTDLSVVLEGETGSGKEVAARALHRTSRRRERTLVVVDCGALQENLVESELFGHERGAFTGAVDARTGAFEDADGGTIFLDEVGELPPALQTRLLRALESGEVKRLGSNKMRSVDVRVIAATHRDLAADVAAGRFRADLFFRLSEVRIRVPPLRERPEDVEPLARSIAGASDPGARFRPDAIDALRARRWPGNVRELGNVVRRAVVAAAGEPIGPQHLGAADLPMAQTPAGIAIRFDLEQPIVSARNETLTAFHRTYLSALLERYDGDVAAVAKHAGVAVTSLHRLLRNAGLKGE